MTITKKTKEFEQLLQELRWKQSAVPVRPEGLKPHSMNDTLPVNIYRGSAAVFSPCTSM